MSASTAPETAAKPTPLRAVPASSPLEGVMRQIGRAARAAARTLSVTPAAAKDEALHAMAAAIRADEAAILAANAADVEAAPRRRPPASLSRQAQRLHPRARWRPSPPPWKSIAALPRTPSGGGCWPPFERRGGRTGSVIERVATPLGVIGVNLREPPQRHR